MGNAKSFHENSQNVVDVGKPVIAVKNVKVKLGLMDIDSGVVLKRTLRVLSLERGVELMMMLLVLLLLDLPGEHL